MKKLLQNKLALFLSALIFIILIVSLGAFWLLNTCEKSGSVAEIYQDGELVKTIHLDMVTENYSFTVKGEHDVYNVIEVRPGEIGIVDASCPDGLCIHMGFIHSPGVPVTCLPNKLIIKVIEAKNSSQPDGVVY
ncbi:MAG: NusG domain II-containing protein [Lachnospiraceae bacterium]|nr:NusG domain II-containing protein [Lachnospiraceae bacterium]